jgi:hypothetical protein
MRVVILDGPSKTGKTCLGRHLTTELQPEADGRVRFDSIGDFFRKMTVGVIEEVGPNPGEAEMLSQLQKVIASDAAFDASREWGDLHSDEINALVSTVGSTALAQTTRSTWAERASSVVRSENVGLWVVDGRNPRRTLEGELAKADMSLVLDMFVDCDVVPASLRSGSSIEELERRRAQDVGGSDPLLVYPANPIVYEPIDLSKFPAWFAPHGCVEDEVIAKSWEYGGSHGPQTVYLDTSELGIDDADLGLSRMLDAGMGLVQAALRCYNDANV